MALSGPGEAQSAHRRWGEQKRKWEAEEEWWGRGRAGGVYLDEVNRYPLIPPKVDRATEMGITQENIPSSFSPKVCNSKTATLEAQDGNNSPTGNVGGNVYKKNPFKG